MDFPSLRHPRPLAHMELQKKGIKKAKTATTIILSLCARRDNVIDLRDATLAGMEAILGNGGTYRGRLWRWVRPVASGAHFSCSGTGDRNRRQIDTWMRRFRVTRLPFSRHHALFHTSVICSTASRRFSFPPAITSNEIQLSKPTSLRALKIPAKSTSPLPMTIP